MNQALHLSPMFRLDGQNKPTISHCHPCILQAFLHVLIAYHFIQSFPKPLSGTENLPANVGKGWAGSVC